MLRALRNVPCLVAIVAAILPVPSLSQAPADVPRDHWAYAAVEDLASKGLIKGYPPTGNFFGKRTVTRYEMATIIQRALVRVDELLANKANKADVPRPAQLDEVRKLVDDFKVELTVIGTDLQKVKDEIGELSEKVGAAQQSADRANAAAEKARSEAKAAQESAAEAKQGVSSALDAVREQAEKVNVLSAEQRKNKVGGYMQARFESFDTGRNSLFTPTGAGGTGQTPTTGGPAVGGPYYNFMVRRARINISGPVGDSGRTDYKLEVDFPSNGAFNLKDAWINIAGLPTKRMALTAGQFFNPFGYEINYTPRLRPSPERALGFSDSTQSSNIFRTSQAALGGTVTPGSVLPIFYNQEFDQGIKFTYSPPLRGGDAAAVLAVVNGEGNFPAGGVKNSNNGADVIGKIMTTFDHNNLSLGLSGYYGTTAVRGAPPTSGTPAPFVNALREFGGVYAIYNTPWKTLLRTEWMGGIQETTPDRALYLPNNHVQAWYVSLTQPLSKKMDVSLIYDEYMPISQAGKTAGGLGRMDLIRKTLQGGVRYWLDSSTRFRLWYQRGLTPFDPSGAGVFRDRLGYITGEVQITY